MEIPKKTEIGSSRREYRRAERAVAKERFIYEKLNLRPAAAINGSYKLDPDGHDDVYDCARPLSPDSLRTTAPSCRRDATLRSKASGQRTRPVWSSSCACLLDSFKLGRLFVSLLFYESRIFRFFRNINPFLKKSLPTLRGGLFYHPTGHCLFTNTTRRSQYKHAKRARHAHIDTISVYPIRRLLLIVSADERVDLYFSKSISMSHARSVNICSDGYQMRLEDKADLSWTSYNSWSAAWWRIERRTNLGRYYWICHTPNEHNDVRAGVRYMNQEKFTIRISFILFWFGQKILGFSWVFVYLIFRVASFRMTRSLCIYHAHGNSLSKFE